MTIYYNSQQQIFRLGGLFQWRATIFSTVLGSKEFWLYVSGHLLLVTLCKYWIKDSVSASDIRWEIASIMQYFMTFFITFYNDKCFERYMLKLYPMCCELVDAVEMFVHELNVSFHYSELEQHRTCMTKYMLAAIYEFFMIVTGGKLTHASWREMTKHGLLTKKEATMLAQFPGHQTILVLTSWVMLLAADGLKKDCFWLDVHMEKRLIARKGACIDHEDHGKPIELKPGQPVIAASVTMDDGRVPIRFPTYGTVELSRLTSWRPLEQLSVHIYNRLNKHVVTAVRSAHSAGFLMAQPLPFMYYHLMCVTLVLNIVVLAFVPALVQNYATVGIFGAAVLVTQGIKSISSALADPFGQDELDFPVPEFVNHAFDRIVCLLLAFKDSDVRNQIIGGAEEAHEFQDRHLSRPLEPQVLYVEEKTEGRFGHKKSKFSWHRRSAISLMEKEAEKCASCGSYIIGDEVIRCWRCLTERPEERKHKSRVNAVQFLSQSLVSRSDGIKRPSPKYEDPILAEERKKAEKLKKELHDEVEREKLLQKKIVAKQDELKELRRLEHGGEACG